MKYLMIILGALIGCSHPYEIEQIAQDVLKYKEGVEIEIEPIQKGK